ncbi:cation diffusion facilitator family transporter [Cohnella nanjingensis]|uniref:Cation transporter n=1 Tax=Cohnella nanjingensis TaxID=1387779 RepID=A0A7X0RN97_9BACL|nr:cation diffusion facilitator family transporter [Cohnella nanjingensis]MBB6669360.1 cation transporter [Cohnella nanjingensis]
MKENKAEFGAWLSIGVYIALSVIKLVVGYFSNSKALMADGLNNTTDIIASFAVLIGLKISKKPADADHKYGHSRAETVASMVASFIMAAVGLEVLISSITKFIDGDFQPPNRIAAWVAIFSAVVMYFVYRYNIRLSRKTGSHALKAAAADNRSDALVSLGTVIGILGSSWGLPWLDALTAIIVGLIICKTAWDIFREASHMLTDGFDVKELEKYKVTLSYIDGVEKVSEIKGRIHGNQVFVDLIVEVNRDMSVLESHAITERIENELMEKHQIRNVHVHIEPH